MRETLDKLLRREDAGSGGSELDGERQVVEPAGRAPQCRRRARASNAYRRARPPRAPLSGGTAYSTSPCTRRSSRVETRRWRFGHTERSFESSGAASTTCSKLSRSRRSSRLPMCSAAPALRIEAFAMVSVRESRITQRRKGDPDTRRSESPARAQKRPRSRAASSRCHLRRSTSRGDHRCVRDRAPPSPRARGRRTSWPGSGRFVLESVFSGGKRSSPSW